MTFTTCDASVTLQHAIIVTLTTRLSLSIFHTVSDKNLRRGKAGYEVSHNQRNMQTLFLNRNGCTAKQTSLGSPRMYCFLKTSSMSNWTSSWVCVCVYVLALPLTYTCVGVVALLMERLVCVTVSVLEGKVKDANWN